jgi:hypothetical protein
MVCYTASNKVKQNGEGVVSLSKQIMKGKPIMSDKLVWQYNEIKAEYEANQKTLAEFEAKQAELKKTLIRLNFSLQTQDRGITRPVPVGFMVGRT